MIQAGMGLDGFEGKTAEAVRDRFAYKYKELLQKVVDCREDTARKSEMISQLFLDIDLEDAVIFYSRLEENNRVTDRYYSAMEDELKRYNHYLSGIEHTGVHLSYMPIRQLLEGTHDRLDFNKKLERRLEDADLEAEKLIQSCFENYEQLMVHILLMFGTRIQRKLMGVVVGVLPFDSMQRVKAQVKLWEEKQKLEWYLRSNKDRIMAKAFITTDLDYEAFIKDQLLMLELCQE